MGGGGGGEDMYSLAHCNFILMTAPTVLFYQFLQYQFTEIYKYGLRINVGSCLREYMEKTVSQSI